MGLKDTKNEKRDTKWSTIGIIALFLVPAIAFMIFLPNQDKTEAGSYNSELVSELFADFKTPIPGGTKYLTDAENVSIIGEMYIDSSTFVGYEYFEVDILKIIKISNDTTLLITIRSDGYIRSVCDSAQSIYLVKTFFVNIKKRQEADALFKDIVTH